MLLALPGMAGRNRLLINEKHQSIGWCFLFYTSFVSEILMLSGCIEYW